MLYLTTAIECRTVECDDAPSKQAIITMEQEQLRHGVSDDLFEVFSTTMSSLVDIWHCTEV